MYGITKHDIEFIDFKLEYQKKYLVSRFFDFDDESKSALDFTYSANLNPKKYFAEMNNRIKSIFDYAKDLNLKPVFCTITAPAKYHKKNVNGELKINPNETAKDLTQIFNKFTNLKIFQKMKKELGHGIIYFRVYEPHKSGVPHLHAMLFLPFDYILDIKKKFFEYFTDKVKWGNNKKSLDFRYTWYKSEGGAVAYIMKYVTKTFKNENSSEIQYASYWYIKHNIRRFLCSRTLAPLTVYRKIRYFFKNRENDYLKVTELLKNGCINFSFSPFSQTVPLDDKGQIDYDKIKRNISHSTTISYMRYNHELGEVEDITVWQKNTDLILQSRIKNNTTFKLKYEKKDFKKALTLIVSDFEKYVHSETLNKFVLLPVVPSKLSDYQLYNYFNTLEKIDIDSLDVVHFELTKNEMIKRGFLNQLPTNINEFIQDFNFNPFMSPIEKIKFIRIRDYDLNLPFVTYNFLKALHD